MTPLALAISRALIHFVWQGLLVGILLSVVLFALRKHRPAARYLAGCIALGLLALMPVATTWILYSGSSGVSPAPNPSASQGLTVNGALETFAAGAWVGRLQSWTLPAWSLGVLLFSLRLVLGYNHILQLRRRAKPAGAAALAVVERLTRVMGVRRRVRVLLSMMSESPSVVGWLRPVILLPAATLAGLTPLQLEAILAHEIGHIRRHDYLINILQMVVETMLFYHPAVWWTSKRIRLERELCCDDLAVEFSGNALRYARALSTLEKLRLRAPAIAMASTGGPLLFRIQRLVGATPKECGGSRFPVIVAASLGVLCLALNAPWIGAQDAPGVKVDLGASSVIHRAPVSYPEAARKQKITGTVQVEVKLDSTGNVADARVLTGPEELRRTALQSVLNWHFTSDAARGTRLVTIEFSEQGTGVQVTEPWIAVNFEAEDLKVVELKKRVEALAEAKGGVAVFGAVETQKKLSEAAKAQVANEDATAMQRKLLELKKVLDATQIAAVEVSRRGNPAVGGVLSVISMPGFSDSVRNDLIARLPMRIGDTISSQSMEQISRVVRSYDEHLRTQFVATTDGQIELRIVSR